MKSFEHFVFNYPINGTTAKGRSMLIDRVMVTATAFFYRDGSVRTTAVDMVVDRGGQDITKWIPFLEYNSPANAGDWMKEIEMAAEAQAKRVYEEPVKN